MSFQRPGDYISQLLARLPGGVPSPIASRNWLGSPGGAAGGLGYVDQLLEALPGSPASPLDTFDTETLPVTSGSPWGGLSSTASDAPSWWRLPPLGGDVGDAGFTSLPLRSAPPAARIYGRQPVEPQLNVGLPRQRLFGTEAVARRQGQTTGQTGQTATSGQLPTFTGKPGEGTRDTVLRWLPLAQKYSQKYSVPVEVILASIDSESGGDPKAVGKPTTVGTAYGLLQGIDRIWGKHGDLTDPDYNLDTIVGQLMAPAWQKYKSAAAVRAVTYGGPGAVDNAGNIHTEWGDKALGGWTIGQDINRYLPKVAAYKAYLQTQQQQPQQTAPPQAANGPADLADLWAWLGGTRQPITGRFGSTDEAYPSSGHRGMDIGTPLGTRLTSPVAGTVIAAGDVGGGYGNQVRIATPYGSILLGHLSNVAVQRGQQVTPGTYLGATGSTGRSSGPHLHFELRDANDNPIDPARYYRW